MDAIVLALGGIALLVVLGAMFHEAVTDLFDMFTVSHQMYWEDDICKKRGYVRRAKQVTLHAVITSALLVSALASFVFCAVEFYGLQRLDNDEKYAMVDYQGELLFGGSALFFVSVGLACRLIVLRAKAKAVRQLAAT